jgi:hypothetical protein
MINAERRDVKDLPDYTSTFVINPLPDYKIVDQ